MADTYSISLEGMHNAQVRLERAARNLAGAHTRVPDGVTSDDDSVRLTMGQDTPVDYAQQAVLMIEARNGHEAAAKVIHTQNEVDKYTLDMIA